LALSEARCRCCSRNALLTVEHRQKAPSIHKALAEAQQAAEASPVAANILREQISAAIEGALTF
jgi:pantothenate synthetase